MLYEDKYTRLQNTQLLQWRPCKKLKDYKELQRKEMLKPAVWETSDSVISADRVRGAGQEAEKKGGLWK